MNKNILGKKKSSLPEINPGKLDRPNHGKKDSSKTKFTAPIPVIPEKKGLNDSQHITIQDNSIISPKRKQPKKRNLAVSKSVNHLPDLPSPFLNLKSKRAAD